MSHTPAPGILKHKVPTLTPFPVAGGLEASGQTFDFSKLPNLQEVELGVGWIDGSLSWIPAALSTIKPTTSQHLSIIQLSFTHTPTTKESVRSLIRDAGNDLQWVAKEVARIDARFGGAVDLTVFQDPSFEAALRALRVRFFF